VTREPFLRTRAGRVALLAMLLIDVFVVPVLINLEALTPRVGDVVFAVTMIVAITSFGTGKGRRLVLAVAIAACAVQFLRLAVHGHAIVIADASLSALAMGTFAAMVLVDVTRSDPMPDRLIDVILAYVLVGAMFAFVYEIVNVAVPGSLLIDGHSMGVSDYVYFSFTTMTSVGYGDALPMHPISRTVAMGEALTGQLYVAVLIARFATQRQRAAQRPDGDAG
jgi:voltage-gated potassium channel